MLDLQTSLFILLPASALLGYFIERTYRQGATYNLIGKAAKSGLSAGRAERAVQKHFAKWNWVLLSLASASATLAVIAHFHGGPGIAVVALSVVATGLFLKCLINLARSFELADKELR